MIGICVNVTDPGLFFDSSRNFAMATNLSQNLGICIHLAQRSSKIDYNIAIPIQKYSMAIFYLHPVQF